MQFKTQQLFLNFVHVNLSDGQKRTVGEHQQGIWIKLWMVCVCVCVQCCGGVATGTWHAVHAGSRAAWFPSAQGRHQALSFNTLGMKERVCVSECLHACVCVCVGACVVGEGVGGQVPNVEESLCMCDFNVCEWMVVWVCAYIYTCFIC